MEKIKPVGKNVVIKKETAPKTKGGILLPESAQEAPKRGKVIAVGPGKADKKGNIVPLTLKVGDEVIFSSYAGVEFNPDHDGDSKYLILSEDDVLATIN